MPFTRPLPFLRDKVRDRLREVAVAAAEVEDFCTVLSRKFFPLEGDLEPRFPETEVLLLLPIDGAVGCGEVAFEVFLSDPCRSPLPIGPVCAEVRGS